MTTSEIAKIKQWWPLGQIKKITRFENGVINKSFLVETDDSQQKKYVFRIYTQKKIKDIQFEIDLLSFLRNLPIPEIVKINNNLVHYFGLSPTIIYKYIPGNHLKNFSQKQLKQIGEFLAKFHNQGVDFKWGGKRHKLYEFKDQRINEFKAIIQKSRVNYLDRLDEIIEDVRIYRPSHNLPQGVIHVDIKPENVLFYQGNLNGVIDFDNAYIGPLIFDLAKTMLWFGLEKENLNLNKAFEIYNGYTLKRKINKQEKENLAKMIRFGFASHLLVDFYMMAQNKITNTYFEFLMNDFFRAYVAFKKSQFHV